MMRDLALVSTLLTVIAATTCMANEEGCDESASMKVSLLQRVQSKEQSQELETRRALQAREAQIFTELESVKAQLDTVGAIDGDSDRVEGQAVKRFAGKASWDGQFQNNHPDCCRTCSSYCSPWSGSCKTWQSKPYYQKCRGSTYVSVEIPHVGGWGKIGITHVPLDELEHHTFQYLKEYIARTQNKVLSSMGYWRFAVHGAMDSDFAQDGQIYPGQTLTVSFPDL
mmetsp:Transcript_60523/g.169030  ORF Transcript_60523/g.169030 Transcript_60523/m.169030 type:complete len:226 (-) Transcript_60523:85-762(-)